MKRINIQKCQTFYFKTSIDNEEDKHPEMLNMTSKHWQTYFKTSIDNEEDKHPEMPNILF